MAKEQNLSLNPTKISGACGRLMCCLKNEQETYEYLNGRLPAVGDSVTTAEGIKGEVHSVSVLRQLVTVLIDNGEEKELREYHVDDLKFVPKKRKDVKLSPEELKELQALEDNDTETESENQRNQQGNRNRGNQNQNGNQRNHNGGSNKNHNQNQNQKGNNRRGNNRNRGRKKDNTKES